MCYSHPGLFADLTNALSHQVTEYMLSLDRFTIWKSMLIVGLVVVFKSLVGISVIVLGKYLALGHSGKC